MNMYRRETVYYRFFVVISILGLSMGESLGRDNLIVGNP